MGKMTRGIYYGTMTSFAWRHMRNHYKHHNERVSPPRFEPRTSATMP